jgi:DNA-directed RNA polymerase specialized sigma24 family protein
MRDEIQNELQQQAKTNAVITLRKLAMAIESGSITSYDITQSGDGAIKVAIGSHEAQQRPPAPVPRSSVPAAPRMVREFTDKLSPQSRRADVKKMFLEGLTQTEIAEKTSCSQKTISNDIQKLKDSGEL